MDRNDHSVYLTFDDGPIPESTPFLLRTLAEYPRKSLVIISIFFAPEKLSFRSMTEYGDKSYTCGTLLYE